MGLIIWGDAYKVGVEKIDTQHRGLIKIIIDLHEAIQKNITEIFLNEITTNLVTYTREHFTTEENLMLTFDYPEYKQHLLQHQEFIDEVTLLVQDIERGENILNISLFTFLKDWLLNHIAFTDMKLGTFLTKNISAS